MAIEKYFDKFDGPVAVFDPVPSFRGEWYISYENLVKNAKEENGKNLFLEFMKKYYDNPLTAILQTSYFKTFPVKIISLANSDNHGRCLLFSDIHFYWGYFAFLNYEIDKIHQTEEEHNEYLKEIYNKGFNSYDDLNLALSEALKIKCERLKDVLNKEFNSEYFEAAMKDYAFENPGVDFHTYIETLYDVATKLQTGILKLNDFFNIQINYQELYEAFDPDKFYLLCAVALYDNILKMAEKNKIIKNCNGYLEEYVKACETICHEEKNYNPSVLYQMESGKKLRYTRRELQRDYEEFMEKHPDAKPLQLPPLSGEERDKYREIDLMEKLTSLKEEDTRINWELLPKGEGEKLNKNSNQKIGSSTSKVVDENDVTKRIDFLENTGYVGKLKGLNTFTGYYGYVYPNGTVILEKFWEDEESIRPAVNYATYVMNIDNFIDMSKISRINLVEYIRTLPEIGVKRLYHSNIANWERNIYKEINGIYRLEDAVEFINSLKSGGITHEQ